MKEQNKMYLKLKTASTFRWNGCADTIDIEALARAPD